MSFPFRIAIIGAGFSGTMAAAQLLRQADRPLTIHLLERAAERFGRGVAYSTSAACHLLNVPAGNMSAYPEDSDHFLRWAGTQASSLIDPPWVTAVAPESFLPRRAYGAYLRQLLDDAERQAGQGVRLERVMQEAVGLDPESAGVRLRMAGGGTLVVDRVVLALGNFRPGNPAIANPSFYDGPHYHGDPWAPDLPQKVLRTQSCLLIGSGLTMVDWAIALSQVQYRGLIHAVSRRGLWPQPHARFAGVAFSLRTAGAVPRVRDWLHQIRRFIRTGRCDWRAVIDALRPSNQALWQSLSHPERRRFLSHLRPYWDCHRHRIAPVISARLNALIESGQLVRHVGRIRELRDEGVDVEVVIRERGNAATSLFRVGAVLNCSGSESDYRKLDSPLVQDLLARGLARPDPLRLGLDVDGDGALIGRHGVSSETLYTLGPPQKGILWETTAVPEIRVQAERLAASLLSHSFTDSGGSGGL